jgi:alanine-glyoxylate transaminase/serine-glyoxylate transaminase/serine-pyruvate transaminase
MKENVIRSGATAVMVEDDWGKTITLEKVDQAIRDNPDARVLAFVHAETSTGVRSDAAALCALAHKAGMLSIVDTVTGLGGIEVAVDDWGADAVYSGTQKCLSCVPGLSPVTFSDRAVERIRMRQRPVQSWFLDLNLVMQYWGGESGRSYHHTAPINTLYALHESLTILREEGLDNAWRRHAHNHRALRAGLEVLGLELVVDEKWRLPQLNLVSIPDGVDDAKVRGRLLRDYNLEIGGGLGALAGKVWRIGLMGYASSPANVRYCLAALEAVFAEQGRKITAGAAIQAADKVLAA